MLHSPRKILLLSTSDEVGGGNRSLLTIAEGLRSRGVEVVSTCPTKGRFSEECSKIDMQCIIFDYEQPEWKHPIRLWKKAAGWKKLFQQNGIDIIHANDPRSARAACIGARWASLPMVCHVRFGMETTYTKWVFHHLPKPNIFIFNSQALRNEHASDFDKYLPDIPREVLHNAVDINRFFPTTSKDRGQAIRPRIGILANLIPVKGHLDFLEMAQLLTERRGRNFDFRILGDEIHDSGYSAILREKCRILKLDDVIDFAGFQSDVPAALNDLDILVCPSHVEPFGRSLIEAMGCALPIVATRVGGIPEVVEDNVTGFLVPPKSPEDMANAVERLLDEPTLLRRMGAAGRKRALEVFGVDTHVDSILNIYGKVLE